MSLSSVRHVLLSQSQAPVPLVQSNARNLSLLFNRKPVVSVLNLHGQIFSSDGGMGGGNRKSLNIDALEKGIDKAFKPKRLESVLLSVNSPGGSAVQSELIADYILMKSKEKKIPVYSFAQDMALSGGYWLACAGEKIFVTKSSVIGSVGVIHASFGLDKLIAKWGIERRVNTAGKNKSLFDPFVPEKEEDKKIMTALLLAVHKNFKGRTVRGNRRKENVTFT